MDRSDVAASAGRLETLRQHLERLQRSVYRQRLACDDLEIARHPLAAEPPPSLSQAAWKPIHEGQHWGERQGEYWFRTRLVIPPEWTGETVALVLQLGPEGDVSGPEALVYVNGRKAGSVDRYHRRVLLTEKASAGEEFAVLAGAYCGHHDKEHALFAAEFTTIDREAEGLYYDAAVLLDWLCDVPLDEDLAAAVMATLEETFAKLGSPDGGALPSRQSVLDAREHLHARLDRGALRPRLVAPDDAKAIVHLVGHSHIDVAWFWTVQQVRLKCLRTFSNVLHLMDRYPDFHFTQSQPQLYSFVKKDAPELYEAIRQRVAEGRWEPIGNTWVEPDCNIPSGESLVRQFLLGRRFVEREFSYASPVMWMPDAFGYTAALPQIILRSGVRYFMTTKLSWNDTNRMPHDTFRWRGIDGSEVLAHFITTPCDGPWQTYNGEITPKCVRGCWEDYREKEASNEVLFAFGWGDGGGGPTDAMLETGRRLKSLPGLPDTQQGRAEDFFRRLEARNPKLPVWDGELYLEFHRGTYTSQARNKRWNRHCEHLYHNAELFSALAWLDGHDYPAEELEHGWELILRNQFHDILPGSSVGEVYAESEETYRQACQIGNEALDSALKHLSSELSNPRGEPGLVVFNPLSCTRDGLVAVPFSALPRGVIAGDDRWEVVDPQGRAQPIQWMDQDTGAGRGGIAGVFQARELPPLGYRVYTWRQASPGTPPSAPTSVQVDERHLENEHLRVSLDDRGQICSVWDKDAERELLPPGSLANLLQLFDEDPRRSNAWDIDRYCEQTMRSLSELEGIRVIERGPFRVGIEIVRSFSRSRIEQQMLLAQGSRRLDFVTTVDWHERNRMLKASFPLEVRSRFATFDIQFGALERPIHRNTSWDEARHEVWAHKWVDVSEGDYGASLLNNGKYGLDIRDNVVRLTLLRAPSSPDPKADEGRHEFTYSLYPHVGDWRQAATVREGYQLNLPVLCRALADSNSRSRSGAGERWLAQVEPEWVILETVKKAEDSDNLVVRLFESEGRRGAVRLHFSRPVSQAWECNLMEVEDQPLEVSSGHDLLFRIQPYQIRTFKVRLSS